MKILIYFSMVSMFSISSLAQTHPDSATSKGNEIGKQVGIILRTCPASIGAKVLIAVGETVPVLSAFVKIGHDTYEVSKQIEAIKTDREIPDNSYMGHSRSASSYFWGGAVATVYAALNQAVSENFDPDSVKKAFADGYFVTGSETSGLKSCSEATSKLKTLIKQ